MSPEHNTPPQVATILGVAVHCVQLADLLALVARWAGERQARMICYVNAHCLNVASHDARYRATLNAADLVYADGVGVVWAARLLESCRLAKLTGADWIDALCALAAARGWRIYVVAGQPGVAALALRRLQERHPGLQIAGWADGFWREKSEGAVIAEIQATRPHLLLVGRGTPRQELWISQHRAELPVGVVWAVGALFDYVAGLERRAPAWMRRLALEWLWRLLVDPLGKWRRFVVGIPLFMLRVLWSRVRR